MTKFDSFSNRPNKIKPEALKDQKQECNDCIVALVTVEKKDEPIIVARGLVEEIIKMCKEVGRENIALVPFAHLSNKIANSEKGVHTMELLEEKLKKESLLGTKGKFNVKRAHFGSNKSLLLDVFGHAGNVRYREF